MEHILMVNYLLRWLKQLKVLMKLTMTWKWQDNCTQRLMGGRQPAAPQIDSANIRNWQVGVPLRQCLVQMKRQSL